MTNEAQNLSREMTLPAYKATYLRAYKAPCLSYRRSTSVEGPLQISSFMQNKANVKIGKMNIRIAIIRAYDNEQRTINNERYSKQTQTNPKQTQTNPISTSHTVNLGTFVASKLMDTILYIIAGPLFLISMHREIMKAPAGFVIDHINYNGLDNRKANLRIATHTQNVCHRRKLDKSTRSRYKGAYWEKGLRRWRASIQVNGKRTYLGIFKEEIQAAKAYDKAAKIYHKEFAALNFEQ